MIRLLFTCEHGGHNVPLAYRKSFRGSAKLLASHRGWDFGALAIAKHLARQLDVDLLYGETTRLLIDLNRSLHSPDVYSSFLNDDPTVKAKLRKEIYEPYRKNVLKKATRLVENANTLAHFSIHSFTPVRNGVKRDCEIGILFDPKAKYEARLAKRLQKALSEEFPKARVKMNYPYKGTGDGQTTDLRARFPKNRYSGIEIEFNQSWLKRPRQAPDKVAPAVARALVQSLLVQE